MNPFDRTTLAVLSGALLIAAGCSSPAGLSENPTSTSTTSTTQTTVPAATEDLIPVILDGDFGPDDMMAMLYLLGLDDHELLAVTVTGTGLVHCPAGAENAMAILDYVGRPDVPVGCGGPSPLEGSNAFPEPWRAGSDALAKSLALASSPRQADSDGVGLLISTIGASEQPVQLVVVGPLTNVAQALVAEPGIAANIERVVIMGGAVDVNGSIAPDYLAEWNLWVDPTAANVVLESGIPVTIVPLDATNHVPVTRFFYQNLSHHLDTPGARLVYRFLASHGFKLEGGSYFFWDPLAAVALARPDILDFEPRHLRVDELTGALRDAPGGARVQLATAADRRAFEEEFLTVLNQGRFVAAEIPDPQLHLTYTGDTCVYEGGTTLAIDKGSNEVYIELINETEESIALGAGSHDGASWEQLQIDAATYLETGVAPDYWVEAGAFELYGKSVTGGRTVGALHLSPGIYALACIGGSGEILLVTDVEIKDSN